MAQITTFLRDIHIKFFARHLQILPYDYKSLVRLLLLACSPLHLTNKITLHALLCFPLHLTNETTLHAPERNMQDTSRLTLAYFCLAALDVLDGLDVMYVPPPLYCISRYSIFSSLAGFPWFRPLSPLPVSVSRRNPTCDKP